MSGAWLSLLQTCGSMFLMMLVVSILQGRRGPMLARFSSEQGIVVVPLSYVLVSLVGAFLLSKTVSTSLVCVSVCLFVFTTKRQWSTHLILVPICLLISFVTCGWGPEVWSLLVVPMLWLLDEVHDFEVRSIHVLGRLVRVGIVDILLLMIVLFTAAVLINALWTALLFIAVAASNITLDLLPRRQSYNSPSGPVD